jgi:hypothetical protein
LFLYSYEAVVIQWIIKKNEKKLARSFITNTIMNSDPALGGMYPIQHYVIKFVSDLRQVGIDAINKITKL